MKWLTFLLLHTLHHHHYRPLTHPPLDKMAAISQRIFSDAFSWMKSFAFWLKFHWSLFLGSNWQWPSTGLYNGLAANRRQANIWTNTDPIHWLIHTSLGGWVKFHEVLKPQELVQEYAIDMATTVYFIVTTRYIWYCIKLIFGVDDIALI